MNAEPQEHGTVRAALTGWGPDLVKLGIFFEAVIAGHNPAEALAELRLTAITITEMRPTSGRGDRIAMVFKLEPAQP